jgi:hypothetical protein
VGPRRAWLLNFEAEFEMARPGAFTPNRKLGSRLARLRSEHAHRVLGKGDRLIEVDGPRAAALETSWEGFEGCAWCPTVTALARLRGLGLEVPPAPTMETLRRANDRAFSSELGQHLPGGFFTTDALELESRLLEPSISGAWICKRAHGVSGRGKLRLRGTELGESQRAWLAASLRLGGLQVEPLVDLELEFASHGWLDRDGGCELRPPCVLVCDAQGAWIDTRKAREGEMGFEEQEALLDAARLVGERLAQIGYFGPFGVDAFRWRDADGGLHLQPCSEVNGRYTLGWRVSFPEH